MQTQIINLKKNKDLFKDAKSLDEFAQRLEEASQNGQTVYILNGEEKVLVGSSFKRRRENLYDHIARTVRNNPQYLAEMEQRLKDVVDDKNIVE